MKINFNIDRYDVAEAKIFLVAFIQRKRLKFYTTIRVSAKCWDKNKQRIKISKNCKNALTDNRFLDFLQTELYDKYKSMIQSGQRPTVEILKIFLHEITFKIDKTKSKVYLIDYWQSLIDQRVSDPTFSRGTTKTYITAKNHFISFCKIYGNHDFDQIDLVFLEKFKAYLFAQDFSINYVEKLIQQLKVMLNHAYDYGITDNQAFKKRLFNVKKTATDEIYLTPGEIKAISKLEMNKGAELTRRCFLLQYYTGAAYADIDKVNKYNISKIDGHKILSYYRGKTKKLAAIPVHPELEQIMSQRKWEAYQPITNQKYNLALKEIGKAAGITQIVTKRNTKGGIEKIESFPKYKLIGSHTARRSFSTNYILSGGTKAEVRLMIGHLKQDVTETYIKADMQKRAVLLAERPFFTR